MSNNVVKPIDLYAKRKCLGMTQKALGDEIGLTEFHVLRIEKGQKGMSLKTALKCVKKFGKLDFIDEESGTTFTIIKKE